MNSKYTHQCLRIAIFFMPFAMLVQAAPESTDLTVAQEQYKIKISAAINPIQIQYISYLNKLKDALTIKGDLTGASAVQTEITRSTNAIGKVIEFPIIDEDKTPQIHSKLSGTAWMSDAGDSKLTFMPSGQTRQTWHNQTYLGTWKAMSDIKVEVTDRNGRVVHFILDPEKGTLWRPEEPVGWHRAK